MINPFDYWPSDPNGYLRHVIVGAIMVLVFAKFNQSVSFAIILLVALAKELADAFWLDSFWSWLDIVLTLAPYVFLKLSAFVTKKGKTRIR